MVNRDAPYSGLSSLMAMQGRYGDTELVHMSKPEIQGLASLGQLTINPDTGLPEAFSLKSIIPMAASVIGGMVAGPAGAAIGSGLGTLATGGSAEQALLGAAMSFGMGYAMQGFGGSIFGDLGASAAGAGAGAGAGAAGEAAALSGATGFEATAGELAGSFSPQAAATELINPATGIAPISAQLGSSFTPVTDSLLPFNLNSTPSGVIGDVGSAAIPQSAIPSAARIGPTTTAAKFLGTTATPQPTMMFDPNLATPQPTMPSAAELEGYRAGLGDFAPRQDTILEQVTEGVSDVGQGISNIYKDYLSPSRQSIQPTQAEITKAFEARAAELQLPSVDSLGVGERAKIVEGLKPGFLKKYGPLGAIGIGGLALTGAFDEEEPEQQQMAKREVDTGFGSKTLTGGEVRRPVATEEELRRMALEGGRRNYFTPYRYAAEGGLIGLQQGGMPTPQASSAMAGMLAQPQPQQPLPINVQVQPQQPVMPQQPQPSMPMPPQQMGSGVTPLPDQQKEFMKLMDMEDQVQSQKRSQSTQALANLMGLGMDFVGSQYPQTSPSGQAVQPPPTPPMNYGSQVNMGLAAGGQPYFEGQVQGPGDGQSDEVAFRVDGGQVDGAMLSPDEYVLAADVVSAIGNGSSDAGAAKLDQFMKGVRQDAYGTTKQMQPFNNQGLTNLVA